MLSSPFDTLYLVRKFALAFTAVEDPNSETQPRGEHITKKKGVIRKSLIELISLENPIK